MEQQIGAVKQFDRPIVLCPALRSADEVCLDFLFWRRGLLAALVDALEQPGHVAAEDAHGLQSLGILFRFAGCCAVHAVPVV